MSIRYLLAGAAFASLGTPLLAAPEGWSPVFAPTELDAILAAEPEIRIVDVRSTYGEGHVPGAVSAPYAEWRGPADNPGQLPEVDKLRTLVQRLGITPETPVVVVHQGDTQTDFGTAARVYWTLKSLGVEDLAVLNGGFLAWQAADLPVATEVVTVPPSDFAPDLSDEWRITTAEVNALIESGETAQLIDARPTPFFQGLEWAPAASRPGTLPEAENLTFDAWFADGGTYLVDAGAARGIAQAQGATDAPLTVSFCNTGHWAAINWFALSELAEIPNTRLYAESMVEWSNAGGRMMNEPGRLHYYWLVTQNWLNEAF